MNLPLMLIETILAGFIAVACLRTCIPANPNGKLTFSDLLRFPGRLERMKRSRWQWFSMVALLLVLRLQGELPVVLELIVLAEFVAFLAVPVSVRSKIPEGRGNATAVGSR